MLSRHLQAEVKFGLESMVFIDDSLAERELMRRLRPEVLTPEWPADAVMYRTALVTTGRSGSRSL